MLSIRTTVGGKMTALEEIQEGCWVNLTCPTEAELERVSQTLGIDQTFLRAALDEEETSRIDTEEGQTLVIIDLPSAEETEPVLYSTLPPRHHRHREPYCHGLHQGDLHSAGF